MAEFAYDAINAQGMLTSGVISAPDVSSAREQLQSRGLLPSSLAEKAAAGEETFGSMFKKIKPKSLQIFARQLATMIEAGVSVVAALVTLEDQTEDKYLKEVVGEVRADVESGMIFSRALARHPKVFSRLFVAMLSSAAQHSADDLLSDVTVPTLVIAGERDGFTPAERSRAMAAAIPDAELLEIPSASHTAPIERPHLVDSTIRDFVARRIDSADAIARE